jgi:hypothetical protein
MLVVIISSLHSSAERLVTKKQFIIIITPNDEAKIHVPPAVFFISKLESLAIISFKPLQLVSFFSFQLLVAI